MELDKSLNSPPQIITYKCYRVFLHDYYQYRKCQRAGFSYRQFASLVGLKSPNYLQLVIQEKRNLTPETGERIAKVLKLNKNETDYFIALIKRQEAKNDKEREEAIKHLRVAQKRLSTTLVDSSQKAVLSNWQFLVVRELVMLKDFEPTGEYISKKLSGVVTPQEGESYLRQLLQSGFVKLDDKGNYEVAEPVLSTGTEEFFHSQLQTLHSQILSVWAKNLTTFSQADQELHYLNIPINSKKVPELKKRIFQFQEEIIGWLQDEDEADQLVQLGTYLIPYSKD